jgi:hypothetical protein
MATRVGAGKGWFLDSVTLFLMAVPSGGDERDLLMYTARGETVVVKQA